MSQSVWHLRKKLILMGLLIGSLSPMLGAFMIYKLSMVTHNYSIVSDVKLNKTRLLGELQFEFRQIRIPLRSVPIMDMPATDRRQYISDTLAAIANFKESMSAYEASIENNDEREIFKKLKAASASFLNFGASVLSVADRLGSDPEAIKTIARMIREECNRRAEPVEESFKELVRYQTQDASMYVREAHEREDASFLAVILGSVISFTISMLLALWISGSVRKQLKALIDQLQEMAGTVRMSSRQLETSAENLSQSTTEEAAALAQTASSMEEVSAMIDQTARNVGATLDVTQQGSTEARNGRKDVQKMLSSMNEIQASNDKLEKIVKLIEDIKGKTRVINDIVSETRLLSFNASIEAARAGAQGKGFAVVAEEVGNLASVSGKAADEIRELLESSTAEVTEIVRSTKDLVNVGRSNAEDCERAFDRMTQMLDRIAESVGSIEQASIEQEKGVKESNLAISRMDNLSQSIAREAESLLSEAATLSEQASRQTGVVIELDALVDSQSNNQAAMNPQQYVPAIQAEPSKAMVRVKASKPASKGRKAESDSYAEDRSDDSNEQEIPTRDGESWKEIA